MQHVENCGNHWLLSHEQKEQAFENLQILCKTEFEVIEPVEPVGPPDNTNSAVVSPKQEASDTDLEMPVLEPLPRPCLVVPRGSTAAVRTAGACISYTLDYPIISHLIMP